MDERQQRLMALIGLGVLASAARTVMSEDRRTIGEFMRALVLAGFVGWMVMLITENYGMSPSMQGAVVGIAAFLADDILLIVIRTFKRLKDNPKIIFEMLFRFILGFRGKE